MKRAVEARGIRYLVHFTRYENLAAILENGLKPRADLEKQIVQPVFNDIFRHDCRKWANCLSIDHPNYRMFYPLRGSAPNQIWVVIVYQPIVLWELPCLFSPDNAASNIISRLDDQQLQGERAFHLLFEEVSGKPSRNELGLDGFEPTNPQAEVLVGATIPTAFIKGIATMNQSIANAIRMNYPGLLVKPFPEFYSARRDYGAWNGQ